MFKNLKLKFFLFAVLVYIASSFAQTANANSLSLSLDPSIIEIHAIPPSITTSILTIQNKGDSEVVLQIQLKPFEAKSENVRQQASSLAGEAWPGELEYLDDKPVFFKNVQILDNGVPVENISLGPNQQKNLTLSINILQDTNLSDYYFSILFVSKNSLNPASNASLNQLGIASNVLLSVGAKETANAVLQEFSSKLFFKKGPVPFTIRVKNKGKHFIKPKGEILIKNMFGQSIGKLNLLSVNILKNSARAIPNDLYMQELRSQDSPDSKIKSNLDFKNPKALWKEDFLLGFYTATLNILLSDDGPSFTKSIRFIAFPFQGLIIIVIIVIAAIVTGHRLRVYMKK